MPQIIPIKDLKNTSEISDTFRKTMKQLSMYRDIEISEQQVEKGQIKDARHALGELRIKYGL
jgi:hypothetical protein